MADGWAATVNTPLLPMFQKPSSSAMEDNNNAMSDGRTVDLTAAKLNDLCGRGSVPRINGPEKFRRCTTTPAQLDRRQQRRHQ